MRDQGDDLAFSAGQFVEPGGVAGCDRLADACCASHDDRFQIRSTDSSDVKSPDWDCDNRVVSRG
jgi:hypothetical protein